MYRMYNCYVIMEPIKCIKNEQELETYFMLWNVSTGFNIIICFKDFSISKSLDTINWFITQYFIDFFFCPNIICSFAFLHWIKIRERICIFSTVETTRLKSPYFNVF